MSGYGRLVRSYRASIAPSKSHQSKKMIASTTLQTQMIALTNSAI